MSTLLRPEVGRLRIHGRDPLAARRRVAEVERQERRPGGLPSRASLVVRHAVARPGPPGSDPVAAGVEEAWRDARRPWLQAVDDAPAVWFADDAELLACLVTDLAFGAGDRWWWAGIRRQLGEQPAAVLAAAPSLVPALLARLDRIAATDAVLATIAGPDAVTIASAVALAFAASASDVDTVTAALTDPAAHRTPSTGRGRAPAATARRRGAPSHTWLRRVADTAATRPGAVPAVVHGAAVAIRDGRPLDDVLDGPTPVPAVPDAPLRGGRDASGVAEATAPATPPNHDARTASDRGRDASDPRPRSDRPDARGEAPAPDPADQVASTGLPAADPDHGGDAGVVSDLAGAVFLIDLLRSLGLPDVLEGWHLGSVGAGAVLDGVTRALLRTPEPGEAADPLWRVLADVDGREPGREVAVREGPLVLPVRWRPPHPPANRPVPITPQTSPLLDELHPSLARLAVLLGDHLDEVLTRRLTPLTSEPPATLLRQRGTLVATATHLDVTLSLDGLWLPGRMAGLDLDPGWVPWLGRVVLVHFR